MQSLVAHVAQTSADPYLAGSQNRPIDSYISWFERSINSSTHPIYIAEVDGQAVGFIMGAIASPYTRSAEIKVIGQIDLCWVEPAYRRQGIAKALCTELENLFTQIGIKHIEVQYLLGNHEAETSWQRLGYSPYRIIARKVF